MSNSSVNKGQEQHNCDCSPPDTSICFVEGSKMDKELSFNTKEISESVWRNIKPPAHFGTNQPLVSARKIDVTRAHLTGRLAPRRPEPPMPNNPCGCKCTRKTVHEDDD